MHRKPDDRLYPPDYVSAETLAYRLDCSRSTIDAYVRCNLLPKPQLIGNLQRWDFAEVSAFIRARNQASTDGKATDIVDDYFRGLSRATTPQD